MNDFEKRQTARALRFLRDESSDADARSKAIFAIEAAVIGPRYSGMDDENIETEIEKFLEVNGGA